jgi:predicted transcriptional regulator
MSRQIYYQGEKILKGAANHRRLEILALLNKTPGLSTDQIIQNLKVNYQTGAFHVQGLVKSGHIIAYRTGQSVGHKITSQGESIIRLLIN